MECFRGTLIAPLSDILALGDLSFPIGVHTPAFIRSLKYSNELNESFIGRSNANRAERVPLHNIQFGNIDLAKKQRRNEGNANHLRNERELKTKNAINYLFCNSLNAVDAVCFARK